ncbi:MAG: diaminopimelate decarboxylase [Alphaproteobacteria bacterium]|nr:diaminopimelate decarboxylase [Alphaproteobacteria bacterium]
MNSDFTEKNNALWVEACALSDLAAVYGTPTYIYSAGHIRAQYTQLQESLRRALAADHQPLICYACKANSNPSILEVIKGCGSGLETVSEGELRLGLKVGFDPQQIVATGVGKSDPEIAALLNANVHQINVESLPELENIQSIAAQMNKRANVVFRLNPNVSGGGHHKISTGRAQDKFGLPRADMFKAYGMAAQMSHVRALGVSMHIGSQVFKVETFREAFAMLPELVGELRAQNFTVERLDIGGGFPIRYKDETLLDLDGYARWVADFIAPLGTEIILEPGRYLVGNAGVLLTKVVYVKGSGGRQFLILDAGMNDLIRPTLYEAYHAIEAVEGRNGPQTQYDVVGPVCETGDTFAVERPLPVMKRGDLAVIRSAGAYGFSMASNYNTRPLPAEILVDGATHRVIRARQDYKQLV